MLYSLFVYEADSVIPQILTFYVLYCAFPFKICKEKTNFVYM